MTATSNNQLKKDNQELREKLQALRRENKQLRKDAYWTRPDGSSVLWRDLCDRKGEWAETLEGLLEAVKADRDGQLAENALLKLRVAELTPLMDEVTELRAKVTELREAYE